MLYPTHIVHCCESLYSCAAESVPNCTYFMLSDTFGSIFVVSDGLCNVATVIQIFIFANFDQYRLKLVHVYSTIGISKLK